MKNIVLIGMPGCGKSTIGVLLAKSLLMDFSDTDLIIQKKFGCSLIDIINSRGVDNFIRCEEETISSAEFSFSVIATGGSAVYGSNAMEKLRNNGIVVYLKVPLPELVSRLDNISTRGVAMNPGTSIEELFTEREPLYLKYADYEIDCSGLTAEKCVEKIISVIR